MIDIQRPKYVVFENVRGFVRFDLAARGSDDDPQPTEGLASGLLKILYRCLVAMGYVRISNPQRLSSHPLCADTKSGQESCRLPTTESHKTDVGSSSLLLNMESFSPASRSHLTPAPLTNRVYCSFPSAFRATASRGVYDTSPSRCTFLYRRQLGTSRNGNGRFRTMTSPPRARRNGRGTNYHRIRTSMWSLGPLGPWNISVLH